LCEQLRQNNAELEQNIKQEEALRKTAVAAHREAQSSVAALRTQLLSNESSLSKLSRVEELCKAAGEREQGA